MKIQHYIIALLLCAFCPTILTAQNGWTRSAKGFYGQANLMSFNSKNYYSTNGTLFDQGSTFQSRGLLLYGEYGITDRLTAMLDAPIIMVNSFSSTEPVAGAGSIKLGLKYRLLKQFPLAIQADVDIPTDDGVLLSNAKEPNALGVIEQINLPTSDGELNVWTTLVASHSLKNGKTFGSLYGSTNFRTQGFGHQLQIGAEVGHLFFDKLYLIGKFKIQEKLTSGEPSAGASFLYGEGTTFSMYNFVAMYQFNEHWTLVASYADFTGIITKRRNIYDGATFSLGVAVEY